MKPSIKLLSMLLLCGCTTTHFDLTNQTVIHDLVRGTVQTNMTRFKVDRSSSLQNIGVPEFSVNPTNGAIMLRGYNTDGGSAVLAAGLKAMLEAAKAAK